jgi:hypothetical protein
LFDSKGVNGIGSPLFPAETASEPEVDQPEFGEPQVIEPEAEQPEVAQSLPDGLRAFEQLETVTNRMPSIGSLRPESHRDR